MRADRVAASRDHPGAAGPLGAELELAEELVHVPDETVEVNVLMGLPARGPGAEPELSRPLERDDRLDPGGVVASDDDPATGEVGDVGRVDVDIRNRLPAF